MTDTTETHLALTVRLSSDDLRCVATRSELREIIPDINHLSRASAIGIRRATDLETIAAFQALREILGTEAVSIRLVKTYTSDSLREDDDARRTHPTSIPYLSN